MKRSSRTIASALMIIFALAPFSALAQTLVPSSASLVSELNALQQELSAIQEMISSLLGDSTSTMSVPSTTVPALSIGNILAGATQTACSPLASFLGIAASETCSASILPQQTIAPQSDADPIATLLDALSPPVASSAASVASTSASATSVVSLYDASTTPVASYASLVNTPCSTPNATIAVTGGYSCISICMPIPSSTLECKSGTWQLQ